MILSRSPYYYIIPGGGLNIDNAKLTITIWAGDVNTPPVAPIVYNLAKKTIDDEQAIFEISSYIREFFIKNIDQFDTGSHMDSCWVKLEWELFEAGSETPDASGDETILGIDGFGYYEQGMNSQPAPIAFTSLFSKSDSDLNVPIIADGTVNTVEFILSGNVVLSIDLTSNISSDESEDKIVYLNAPKSMMAIVENDGGIYEANKCFCANDTYDINRVDFKFDSDLITSLNVENIVDFQKTPKEIKFYDKNGTLQVITMMGEFEDSLNVDKTIHNTSTITGQGSLWQSYQVDKHNRRVLNINGQYSVNVNSGWVKESHNEIFKQLILSDHVWIEDLPVIINSENIVFEKDKPTGLINYQLDFNYANNTINNL